MSASKFNFLQGSLALEDKPFHLKIAKVIKNVFSHCEGYVGYKLTTLGRASDADIPSFIIVTRQHGIILVDLLEEKITYQQEIDGVEVWTTEAGVNVQARSMIVEIYEEEVQSRLKNNLNLYDRKTRRAKTPVTSAVVFCKNSQSELDEWYTAYSDYSSSKALNVDGLEEWLRAIPQKYECSSEELSQVFSLLEGTFIYENKSIPSFEAKLETMNDYIQQSLKTTFRQDEAQRQASMQLPPGPQRIRGLAGTGKTIVLSLKAAITHKRFENFKILYLFNTQSLYQHVQNLISKYYTLEAKKAPDFENKLHVLHAWGGRQKPGLYSNLCNQYGLVPITLTGARGKGDPLAFIYKDLFSRIGNTIKPEYDLILIDEAQDFPTEVFEVVYKLAKGEGKSKRIIWAYDEFQSLRDTEIKGPSELFGKDESGKPNLPDSVLKGNYPGDIPKDFVLPNCYRTPRPVLMTAHGVALGLYTARPNEMFYFSSDWKAIGYEVNKPRGLQIESGEDVEIERPEENSRNLLEGLMKENEKGPLNLIECKVFSKNNEQIGFLAETIANLISDEKVAAEEIIIVNLKSGNNKEEMLEIQRQLNSKGVKSIIPGYIESADIFKLPNYVTITTPYRAKGNEANIVFVINAQQVSGDFTLRMRNAFFVAVTRSRGWCYITGYGSGIDKVKEEIRKIKEDFPKFRFICPDPAVVQRGKSFLNKSEKELNEIERMFDLIEKNPELRQLLVDRYKA